jgi:hypothetical protein
MNSSQQRKFIATLEAAIKFHQDNQNDPHGISNAVTCALLEVKNAFEKAMAFPDLPATSPENTE